MRLIWRNASVAWPLVPLASAPESYAQLAARLDQREAMRDGRMPVASVRGPVDLDASRAVGVWIAALETVRVRQIGEPVPLRFIRGIDGAAAVLEPGRPVAPGPGGEPRWELHQPPSNGAVWSIEADAPTTVIVERVATRPTRYVSVEVEHEVLEWIEQGQSADAIPALLEPADDLARRLRFHAALATQLRRLEPGDAKLDKAIRAWRMLAAMAELDRSRPAVRPYYERDAKRDRPLRLDGTSSARLEAADSRDYRLAEEPRRWTVSRRGPGQLRLAARAWAPAGEDLRPAELRVYAGGRLVERLPLSDRQAYHSRDPDTALPELVPLRTEAGDAVGEFSRVNVVLAPGSHDYEIELVGGPALLTIEGTRRIEATLLAAKGWTPRKRAKASTRALAKAQAPAAAPWLELLLSRQLLTPVAVVAEDPRFDALAEASPLLAAAALAELAAAPELDAVAFAALVERVAPWLGRLAMDTSVDPAVRGELRGRWLGILAARSNGAPKARPDARLLDKLIERVPGGADPIAELSVGGLRTLAELFGPTQATVRSPALAVLELARARAPADEGLREQTLRLWTETSRWSRRRPLASNPEEVLLPAGEWLVPRTELPVEPEELRASWLRLEIGEPVRVRAELDEIPVRRELGPNRRSVIEPGRRLRLLDVYVSTPFEQVAPVELRVDEERWWSPMVLGVQRHRVSVAEGIHELELDGPAGTIAWAELLPVDIEGREAEELGRRETMWPLGRSVWRLPGPAVPGVARLELRWPADLAPRPVRIIVHEIGTHAPGRAPPAKVVVFDPRTPQAAARFGEDGPELGDAILTLEPGGGLIPIDYEATPISGTSWATPRHEINFNVDAATTALFFEVEEGLELPASLSLRRGLRPGDVGAGTSTSTASSVGVGAGDPNREFDDVFGGLGALDGAGMLEELGGLSRVLLLDPTDLDMRARRAALLLVLGETGHARSDLLRLASFAARDELPDAVRTRAEDLIVALEARFSALIEPREIVVDDPARGDRARLVEPALAAVVGADRGALDRWLELWAAARLATPSEGLELIERAREDVVAELEGPEPPVSLDRDLLVLDLSRAHLLANDETAARAASRAWIDLYGRIQGAPGQLREPVAVALAAVDPLLRHLDDPSSDGRDAGLAFGLARALEPAYGHTSVRRLAFIAAMRSDWSTINHSEQSAGFERLELPVVDIEPTPARAIRDALAVAPWEPNEAEELRPGRKGVLAWDAQPGTVGVELWCRAARPDLNPDIAASADDAAALGRAHVELRLRASGTKAVDLRTSVEVADAELTRVQLPIDRKARHRLEVVLEDEPMWLCGWRARVDSGPSAEQGEPIEANRRALWWTADSRTEVEIVVLGPASVHFETRAVTNADPSNQPTQLIAEVERLGPGLPRAVGAVVERGELALDGRRERAVVTEQRRSFDVAHATGHTILLTEARPHRIRLRTDRGRALIRARVRRDRGDLPPPAQVSIRELDPRVSVVSETFDWRSAGPTRPVVARDAIRPIRNRLGTLDARVVVGLDDIGDADVFTPRFGLAAKVGVRREIIEDAIWLAVAGQMRVRDQSPVAGGGTLGFGARVPVLGLRLGADLDVLGSSFAGRPAGSVRLYAFVDRPVRLGRRTQLRPGLTAGFRWQSLSPADVAGAPGPLEPHPRIYLRYIHDHPTLIQPELELRVFPFQDMVVWAQTKVVPNSDLRGLDFVDGELGLDGIGRRPRPWVPIWALSYQASLRFADADRSNTYLRHRVSAEIGAGVWFRDIARLAFGLANRLYFTPPQDPNDRLVRDVIELWIRFDGVWGRRMRDYGPSELWFGEPWAPRSFGDDEHQAPSTQRR